MSSLATAGSPRGAARAPALARTKLAGWRVSADLLVGLALAAGFTLETFTTTGGVALGPNTWAEVTVTILSAGLCVVVLLDARDDRAWGAAPLLLFAALGALTVASISWSVQPATSWVEADRVVSYLAAFAGGLALARLAPARWPALIGSWAGLAAVVSGYALLLKVFPATLDPGEFLGRLRAPFDYFNAVGLLAALGLPAWLWIGARRDASVLQRAVTVPAIGLLLVVLVLSYSRGALLVAVAGLVLWFAIVPLRLRSALLLVTGALGGGAVTAWALGNHPITHDLATLSARTTAGHRFGGVLVAMLLVLSGAGLLAGQAVDRAVLTPQLRRRLGIALVVVAACVPVGGVVALASSSRGLTGEISHIWHTVISAKAGGPGDQAGRLVQISNSRGAYWSEGLKVGQHNLLTGVGIGGYGTAATRYSTDTHNAQHAHSYLVETFADLGLLGVILSLALLIAWALAVARTIRPPRAGPAGAHDAAARAATEPLDEHGRERTGLVTLLVIVLMFGLHSAIDWTWFIPALAVPALVCAGWLAGRGPLARPAGAEGLQGGSLRTAHRLLVRQPSRIAGVAVIAALALVCVWMIWQPLRSSDANAAALTALSEGKPALALSQARTAQASDPVSAEPLWTLAAIYRSTGSGAAARAELIAAIRLQPSNPATWQQLAELDLRSGRRREAVRLLRAALSLDPLLPGAQASIAQARAELRRAAAANHVSRTAP